MRRAISACQQAKLVIRRYRALSWWHLRLIFFNNVYIYIYNET
jgi:hypothetical protein